MSDLERLKTLSIVKSSIYSTSLITLIIPGCTAMSTVNELCV